MKIRIPFLIVLSLVVTADARTWTDINGRKIEAEMTGMDPASRSVKVRLADGRDFAIPIASLSAEDIAFAASQWRKMQADGTADTTPLPAAAAPATGNAPNLKLLPPRFIGRMSPASRIALIQKHGGDPKIEDAVTRSLDWLKSKQNEDGSWGTSSSKAGYTGFVLQCLTGHGEGLTSAAYGSVVTKACDFLIQTAAANAQGMLSSNTKGGGGTYEHGIATAALGEAYILAKASGSVPPELAGTFQKAAQFIIESQNQRGSWSYGGIEAGHPTSYNPTSKGEDLSLANWQLQALVAARESGIPFKGLDACLKKAADYLEGKQSKDGGYGGVNSDSHYNQWHMSGGSILGLQMLGSAAKTSKGIRFLRAALTQEPPDWQKSFNLYSWCSNTSAFFNAGGDDWKFYVATIIPQILAAQKEDGSFQAGKASWPAAAASEMNYRQALCTLQLEVFYRYGK